MKKQIDYKSLLLGLNRFCVNEQDILNHYLGVSVNNIKENVVIAPWWEPTIFEDFFEIELLTKNTSSDLKIWNIKKDNLEMTYIKTGIGASCFLEGLLP